MRRAPNLALIRRLAQLPPSDQFTTAITMGELLYGAERRGSERLRTTVRELVAGALTVLHFDEAAADGYGPHPARLEAAGRRPALLGSRLDVADVVTTIRQSDGSVEEAASYLEVPVELVEAAARYYGEYTEEVDALVDRARLAAERERERARRQQEALG